MATKRPKKKKEKVFNDRGRKIFRKYIGSSEIRFGFGFVAFVVAMGVWFAAQKDNYDPGERDISIEVLRAQSVPDNLFKMPLKRWIDPSIAFAGAIAVPDVGIYPPAVYSGGWEVDGRLKVFDWDTLYEKIDGGEVQFKSYGFEAMHYITLANPGEELEMAISLYDMSTFENALGVFAARRPEGTKVEQQGDAYYYMMEVGPRGIVGRYFFEFTGNADSEALRRKGLEIVEEFSASVDTSAEAPPLYSLLTDGLGVGFSGVSYVKEDVFQFTFASDFWFGAVVAGSETRYYVHVAEDEAAASSLFDQILEEQLFEYEELSRDGNSVRLKHEFLDTIFTLRQSGNFVYGIEGAEEAAAVEAPLSALEKAIQEVQ